MAMGIVLATPVKKSDQPRRLRHSLLNLPASNRPAPKPIAPRVTAINASSDRVTFLRCEIFIFCFPHDTKMLSCRCLFNLLLVSLCSAVGLYYCEAATISEGQEFN